MFLVYRNEVVTADELENWFFLMNRPVPLSLQDLFEMYVSLDLV